MLYSDDPTQSVILPSNLALPSVIAETAFIVLPAKCSADGIGGGNNIDSSFEQCCATDTVWLELL